MRSISFLILTIMLVAPAFSQVETKCNVLAFVTDPASGVNVRSGPGKGFGILKTVPRDEGRTIFNVSASKGEWLKVTRAEDSKVPSRTVFAGTGWVFAPVLAVTELRKNYKVFEGPTKRSRRIRISLYEHVLPLAGCNGRWVKIELPVTGTGLSDEKRTGWMPDGSWCGNPAYECATD